MNVDKLGQLSNKHFFHDLRLYLIAIHEEDTLLLTMDGWDIAL